MTDVLVPMSARSLQVSQVSTKPCSTQRIMCHPNFSLGLAHIRAGQPFDADVVDDVEDEWGVRLYWAYDRGRLFGAIAPLSMPLFITKGRLNPKALALFRAAYRRGLIL